MEFTTVEEARQEILRLQEQIDTLTTERETLSQDNKNLSGELEKVRTINQEFYLKLRAQNSKEDDQEDDQEDLPPTCEEFAKNIKI